MFIIDDALTPELEKVPIKLNEVDFDFAVKEGLEYVAEMANEEAPVATGYLSNQYKYGNLGTTGHQILVSNSIVQNGKIVGELIYSGSRNPKKWDNEYAEWAETYSSHPHFVENALIEANSSLLQGEFLGGIVESLHMIFK